MAFAANNLKEVRLPKSLKVLGAGAFLNNKNLENVQLNEGLEIIGKNAFAICNIEKVFIPSTVKEIGTRAFNKSNVKELDFAENSQIELIDNAAFEDNKLEKLVLPESIKEVQNIAFNRNNLSELTILGSSLERIGAQAFGGNKLTEIELPLELKTIVFHSFRDNPGVDGKLIINLNKKLIAPSEEKALDLIKEKVKLSAYCESVMSEPKEWSNIIWAKEKEENNEIVYRGEFEEYTEQTDGNEDISKVNARVRVEIEEEESDFIFDKESQTITGYKGEEKDLLIPEKIDGVEVKKIGKMAFARKKLTSVEIPSTVKKIETGAFLGNQDLASLSLNEGLDTIEDMAFTKAKLKEVEIPGSVRRIGKKAFMDNGMEKLIFKEGRLSVISNEAFKDNKLKELIFPESVRLIDNAAFQNNLLENLEIKGDKLVKIGSQSFGGNQLKEVEIPNTLKSILFHSFKDNPGVDRKVVLKFRDKIEINSIDELEEKIILKAYCQSVGSQDPEAVGIEWKKLNDNLLEGKFKEFQDQTGGNDDIKNLILKLEVEIKNPVEDSGKIDGVVVNTRDKEVYLSLAKYMRMIAIDDGNKAFFKNKEGNIELSKLVSSDKFIDIKDYNENFKESKNIAKAIKASKALDLEYVEDLYKVSGSIKGSDTRLIPFFSSEEWTEADFEIEDGVLKGLSSYGRDKIKDNKDLVIPEGVKIVEVGVFARQGIETIEFNKDIEEVKFNSFMGNNIKRLTIPASMKKIGKSAFSSSKIEEIIFEEGIEEIGEYAFANNNIDSLELPASLRALKEKSFYQSNIHEVIFNDGLELIGNQSFEDNKIEKLILPKTLKAIDVGAFVYNNVKEVSFPYGTEVIGPKAFGVNNMDSVKIPETVEWICPNAFRKNPGFEKEEFRIYIDQDISLDKELKGDQVLNFLNDKVKVRAAVFEDLISKTKHPVDLIDWELIEENNNVLTFRGKFDRLPEDKLNCGFGTSCEDVVSNMEKISLIVEVKLEGPGKVSEGEIQRKNLDELLSQAENLKAEEYTEESFKDITYGINYPERYQIQVDRKIEILQKAIENLEALKEDKDDTEWTIEDFNYEGDTLLGFSDKGLKKFEKSKFISFPEKTSLGENLRKIGDKAFNLDPNADESEQIRGIKLPNTVEEIGIMAFRNNNIKDLDLGHVSILGDGAFARNLNLSSVNLSEDLKEIPNGCFSFSDLTEVDIPEGVEVIGGSAFNESNKLAKVILPSTLKEIGARAFTNINTFSLTIPGNVEKIGMEAFSGGKLSELVLEEGIKEIGKRAFKRNKIENIIIPASVQKLSSDAFDAMPSVNIQYRILLDLKTELEKMEQTDKIKSYINKIDQLNTGKKARLDEALDLYKEIKSETEKSLDLVA